MKKKVKEQQPASPPPTETPSWEAAWKQVGGDRDIPKPAAVELAPRELHFMMIHIASLMSNQKSKEDQKGIEVMSALYQKLFVVQRQWFDDLEAEQRGPKAMVVTMKGTLPTDGVK